MTTILDENLYDYADRVKGAVVVITGGANGIGKTTALDFAKHGAKVVIGDLDEASAAQTAAEITSRGGAAVSQKCDVLNWADQVSLFKLAIARYSKVDIVVPCAGITETGDFGKAILDENGDPKKPNLKTTEINLLAVMQTSHLAFYYLTLDTMKEVPIPGVNLPVPVDSKPKPLKALILIGSVASIQGVPKAPNYSTAKHGILGFMGALGQDCFEKGIHIGTICPWFVDTAIVPNKVKIALAGIPKVPVARVGGAIVRCATEPNPRYSGCAWTLPDGGPVYRLDKERLNEGVFKVMNQRLMTMAQQVNRFQSFAATTRDLWSLFGRKILLVALIVAGGSLVKSRI